MKNLFTLMLNAFEPKKENPKSIVLTSIADVKKNAGKLKKLNVEERQMLTEYLIRTELKKIRGAQDDADYGITVGTAIEIQRKLFSLAA